MTGLVVSPRRSWVTSLRLVLIVVAAGLRWLGRHRRWALAWSVLVLIAVLVDDVSAAAVLGGVGMFPAVVSGVWSTRWPESYERCASGPSRRWRWRRWARQQWPVVARACGLSVESSTRRRTFALDRGGKVASTSQIVRRWCDPQLITVMTRGGTLTLRVRVRVGQSVEEITAVAPKLRDAAGAHSVRCVQYTPSVLDIALVMIDPLAGTRLSAVAPAELAATAGAAGDRPGTGAVVLGRGEDGADVVVDPADAWHLAMQGATRSGKSALSYTLLGALAGRPEVLVCGVDPSGILLSPWEHGRGGAWVATGTADMTRAVDALGGVVAEMDRRITALVAAGMDKVEVFDAGCPLLLVVLEEYPGTLSAARSQDDAEGRTGADRIAPRIERYVGRLVKESAKVGIRLLVLAQRMSAKAVDTDDRSNFGLRVTLRVDNGDAVGMLHDGPAARAYVDAARQFPPGMGLVEGPGRPLQRWRADLTDYATYRHLVAAGITATASEAFTATPAAPSPVVAAAAGDGAVAAAEGDGARAGAEDGLLWSGRKPRAPRKPRQPREPHQSTGSEDAA